MVRPVMSHNIVVNDIKTYPVIFIQGIGMTYTSSIHIDAPINADNQRRQEALIDALFQDYSKLLLVRIDLYWQKQYADVVSHQNMNEAFTQLRNNMRCNRLFEHYITYCAKLEYGLDRGWHFHVLFFFDGQRVRNDYLLAQGIGKYWSTVITRNLGDYYSANMNSGQYRNFAMGSINYHETDKIMNAKAAANYLAKETALYPGVPMLDAAGKKYRSYRQGQYMPSGRPVGRPRMYSGAGIVASL